MAAVTKTNNEDNDRRLVSYYDQGSDQKPLPGQHRRIEVKQADDSIKVVEQVYRISKNRGAEWIKYTARGTLDKRAIILAVKEEYVNFLKEGVTRLQIRNMHYKMMERPELNLGEVADPYSSLDKIITAARKHEVKLRKGEDGPKDKYYIPDEWWSDLKRYNPAPRPFRTPQQFAQWLATYHVRNWVDHYDIDQQPKWFRQDEYYIEIWTEKDTMIGLLEQLVANVLGANQIVVNSASGFDSRSHAIKQIKRLLKHKKRGRMIFIYYFGDYDPSGLKIQQKIEEAMQEMGLEKDYDYKIRRVGVTLEQIKRLHLKEVTDPAKLKALAEDNNGPEFERMEGHNGRRFAVEVDAMSSGPGLKELKKILKSIKDNYWKEDIWNIYKDEFTSEKAKVRVAAELVPYIREAVDESSDNPDQSIEEWATTLESEEDELARIEGDRVWAGTELTDPWDDDTEGDE